MLTEEQKEMYKQHPRVLEIRFALFYQMIEKEFGEIQARKLVEFICKLYNCDFEVMTHLIDARFNIRRFTGAKWKKWRQTIIFIGVLYDISTFKIADYLGTTSSNLYSQKQFYNPSCFITDEWLDELEEGVCLCKMSKYRLELSRFLEVVSCMSNVFKKWSNSGMQ